MHLIELLRAFSLSSSDSDQSTAKSPHSSGKFHSDIPAAHYQNALSKWGGYHSFIGPEMLLLIFQIGRNLLHHIQKHAYHVLRNSDAVCSGCTGKNRACRKNSLFDIGVRTGRIQLHPRKTERFFCRSFLKTLGRYISDDRIDLRKGNRFLFSGKSCAKS